MRSSPLLLLLAVVGLTATWIVADEASDDEKAIEKIELLGGKVTRDDNLSTRRVIGIDLHRSRRFNDKFMHLLKSFVNLKTLNLDDVAVTDDALTEIGELRNLTEIWLYRTETTDRGLQDLKKSLPNARVYEGHSEESKMIQKIERLGGQFTRDNTLPGRPVIAISFQGSTQFGDKSMHLLDGYTSLASLQLTGIPITDEGLENIQRLKNLEILYVRGTDITDVGLKEIGKLQNLTTLLLSNNEITDEGLKELTNLKHLTALQLISANMTDVGLKEICKLKHLTKLHLRRSQITDAGLNELTELKSLIVLSLADSEITDDGLNVLGELKNLKTLIIMRTKVTAVGIEKLKESRPDLKIIR